MLIRHTFLSTLFALAMLLQSVNLAHVHDDEPHDHHVQCQVCSQLSAADVVLPVDTLNLQLPAQQYIETNISYGYKPSALPAVYQSRAPPSA